MEGQLLARGSMEKRQLERRVREMLDVVWLGEFEARRPHQLSGGQPQRVAFARALVNDPKAPPPERMGLPVTCSRVLFQGALLRGALRAADGGDFVAYLEASRHDPAVRPKASLWLNWRSDAWGLLDPDTAPNAATPNGQKTAPSPTA